MIVPSLKCVAAMLFVFPAFIERSADVNSIMYYTKNVKDPHPELMEEALGCFSRQIATIQKETFQTIIKDSVSTNEEKALSTNSEDNSLTPNYDVILQVKPEKIPKITAQIIEGQKCIVIPIDEDEQASVNGLDDLI